MTTKTTPATMRALLQSGYGGVEMLRLGEAPAPAPRAGRVLVRVEAVSPDSGTIHLLTGRPTLVRPFLGLRRPRQPIPVSAGQKVLVIGAGGGVGAYLVQLAVLAGARVTGVASGGKAAFVRSLGAERTIDYRTDPGPEGWGRFDAVIDTADGRDLPVLRRLLTERGALAIVGADHVGGPVLDGLDRQFRAALLDPWVRHRLAMVMQKESGADLAILLDHLAAGRMSAAVDEVVPVERALDAIDRLRRREVRGKVVIALRAR